jgi:hypothetical protein
MAIHRGTCMCENQLICLVGIHFRDKNFVLPALFSESCLFPAHAYSPCRTNDVMRALKVHFHLRTNVTYKCKSTLDLQIGSSVLMHFSANIWYFVASRTVGHVQYVPFVRKWKRTLSKQQLSLRYRLSLDIPCSKAC